MVEFIANLVISHAYGKLKDTPTNPQVKLHNRL